MFHLALPALPTSLKYGLIPEDYIPMKNLETPEQVKQYLDAYSTWVYLFPHSDVKWDEESKKTIPFIPGFFRKNIELAKMRDKVSKEELVTKGDVLVKLLNSGEFFRIFEYTLKPGEMVTTSEDEIGDTKWMKIEDIKKSFQIFVCIDYKTFHSGILFF